MIRIYTGLPGSGKTTKLASIALMKLKESRKIEQNTGFHRSLRTNIKFSPEIELQYADLIEYFVDIYDMPTWKDCDIIIDEISTYFDSQEWEHLPRQIKRYLKLHRHYRVNIYGIAQDFLTVDKNFRRLTSQLFLMLRVFGTAEPMPFEKQKKYPFVFSIQYEVDKKFWELEKEMYQYIGSEWHLFTPGTFKIFDTSQEIPEQVPPPLRRIQRHWTNPITGKIEYTQTRYI